MKKIIALVLFAGIAYGGQLTQTTAEVQTALDRATVELSFTEGATQSFTGAGGFEIVTNLTDNIVDSGYTTTSSNITVSSAGTYEICGTLSFDTASASDLHMNVYTNGVELNDAGGNDIGWRRVQSGTATQGVTAFSRVVTLVASSIVDMRLDCSADEDATWDSGSFKIVRVK